MAEESDPHDLVGRIKSLEQVTAMEGEHCADSVIIGDNAYEVVEGADLPFERALALERRLAAALASAT